MRPFYHLIKIKQGYINHFYDAFSYGCHSLQASFYFFIHALYPDLFDLKGSQKIFYLNNVLRKKIEAFQKKEMEEGEQPQDFQI
jgi:hypothetical protein